MQVRSTNADYLGRVAIFFDQLKQQVGDLQFTRDGPIIAVQIENEYGAYGSDVGYKTATKKQLEDAGFVELLFTSDQPGDLKAGSLEGGKSVDFVLYSLLGPLAHAVPALPLMIKGFKGTISSLARNIVRGPSELVS